MTLIQRRRRRTFCATKAVSCQTGSRAVGGVRRSAGTWSVASWAGPSNARSTTRELQPARLTVDLPAPAALEPIEVHTAVHHDRRRLRLVEAVLTQRGAPGRAGRARCFCGAARSPTGTCGHSRCRCRRCPSEDGVQPSLFMRTYGWGTELQNPDPEWAKTSGPKYTWLHETRSLIDGEPLSAFTRAAMAADITAVTRQLGHKRLAVHQRRLHAHAEPAAGRAPHRPGLPYPLQP